MRVSLNWAHQDGVDFFFFFDWFWYSQQPGPDQQRSPHLNNALANYMKLRDHDGVGAALMYINIDPFTVPQWDWHASCSFIVEHDTSVGATFKPSK
jgi:hypothetical protein